MSARDELMAAIDFDRAAEASMWFCQPDDLRDSVLDILDQIAAMPQFVLKERRPRRVPAKHGTTSRYQSGCRCSECTEATKRYMQYRRDLRRSERVLVDGVMVHPDATHGTESGYQNHICRCRPCVDAHNRKKRDERARARARAS